MTLICIKCGGAAEVVYDGHSFCVPDAKAHARVVKRDMKRALRER